MQYTRQREIGDVPMPTDAGRDLVLGPRHEDMRLLPDGPIRFDIQIIKELGATRLRHRQLPGQTLTLVVSKEVKGRSRHHHPAVTGGCPLTGCAAGTALSRRMKLDCFASRGLAGRLLPTPGCSGGGDFDDCRYQGLCPRRLRRLPQGICHKEEGCAGPWPVGVLRVVL